MLYLRNLGLWLNLTVMTLIGQDPRKTISAFLYLNRDRHRVLRWLSGVVDRVYRDPRHSADAAAGWDHPSTVDRSLWWAVKKQNKG